MTAMKRRLAALLAALALAGLLAGCSGGGEKSGDAAQGASGGGAAPGSDEPVELVWVTHTPETEEERDIFQTDVVDKFEAMHPNVTVKWVEAQDSYSLIRQQLAAGAGPDIVSTGGPTFLSEYVASGYLMPLNEYADKYGWNDRFYDWALQSGRLEDRLYGLPGAYETLVVWYDKQMFEDNGWDVPGTYGELIALSEEMQRQDIMPFAFGTSDFRTVNEWWLSMAYNAYLGPDELRKVLKGEQPWTSDSVRQATERYVDMWRQGFINNRQSHAISMEDAWGVFNNGQAAMKLEGTWALSRLVNTPPPFETGFFIMPPWREGVPASLPIGLGDSIGINAKTKHPELAAELLDLIFSTERAEKLLRLGFFSPMNGMDVGGADGVEPLVAEVYDAMNGMLEQGGAGYVSWTYFPPTVLSYMWNNIDALFLEQITVDEYLANVQKNMEQDAANNMLYQFND